MLFWHPVCISNWKGAEALLLLLWQYINNTLWFRQWTELGMSLYKCQKYDYGVVSNNFDMNFTIYGKIFKHKGYFIRKEKHRLDVNTENLTFFFVV